MKLQDQIKKDRIVAIKAKDPLKRTLLTVLLGELDREGKEVDDVTVEAVIRKMIKNANTIGDISALAEIDVLDAYLPQLMSESDVRTIIENMIYKADGSIMLGSIMKEFNIKYRGKADNKLVSEIARELT